MSQLTLIIDMRVFKIFLIKEIYMYQMIHNEGTLSVQCSVHMPSFEMVKFFMNFIHKVSFIQVVVKWVWLLNVNIGHFDVFLTIS